ncbi:MAG: bifunctional phosphoglucose/phosphomannose isomerase [Candidatus Methanomethylophilaceae archaeon]
MKYTATSVLKKDPSDIAGDIYAFLDNLEDSMKVPLRIDFKFKAILFCGMGGSAIAGDIISDCVADSAKCPIKIQRFPDIPKWVDKDVLVIISSYSGNTKETLSMYEQASAKNAQIIVLSSGGEILERAKENKDFIIKVTPGLQPRCALGYTLGIMINIMDALGDPTSRIAIQKSLPKLKALRDELSSDISIAWEVARRIDSKVPIIYSTTDIASSALRWKSQMNENSKMMAFSGSIPEFSHNEISGWSEGGVRDKCMPIFLYEERMNKYKRNAINASIGALRSYGVEPMVLKIRGRNITEKIIRSVMIGDYVSLYLAYISGVDPSSVASIDEFKSRLTKLLTGRKKRMSVR